MYELVKRNSKFDSTQFWEAWSVLLQILIHETSSNIFLSNKKLSALSFTFMNFSLFWETKVQFLKNVVWLFNQSSAKAITVKT